MTDEEHLQAIDELAAVFTEDQAAGDLLDRIGFPVSRRPVFYPDPRAFWRRVYRNAQYGMTAGGAEALLAEACRLIPHNAFFRRFASEESVVEPPTPIPSVGLSGRRARELAEAMQSAYTYDGLKKFVAWNLERDLEQVSLGDNKNAVLFDLIQSARREGWEEELVAKVCEDKPTAPAIAAFCQSYRATGR